MSEKYVSDFVKQQQALNRRAKMGRMFHNSTGGNTYDPFKKLKAAWEAWATRRKARNDELRRRGE